MIPVKCSLRGKIHNLFERGSHCTGGGGGGRGVVGFHREVDISH